MVKLNFKKYGNGEPLIILHGLFGSLDNWHTLAGRWGDDFSVYTVDQRNHGRSPHTDDMDYRLMAGDLKDFLEEQGLDKIFLLGHSMGGKTAMQFALGYPARVRKLIVADISPRAYDSRHDEIFDALEGVDLSLVKRRTDAADQLSKKVKDGGIRQFLLKNLNRREDGSYEWKMNLPVISKYYEKITGRVEGKPFPNPALFINGGKSNYIRKEDGEEIKTLFPEAEFTTIDGAGHWLHAEKPEDFYQIVKSFLK